MAPDAVEALRCAAEAHLTGLFDDAKLSALHSGKREVVEPKDMQLARRVRGERG